MTQRCQLGQYKAILVDRDSYFLELASTSCSIRSGLHDKAPPPLGVDQLRRDDGNVPNSGMAHHRRSFGRVRQEKGQEKGQIFTIDIKPLGR